MSLRFEAIPTPDPERQLELERLDPTNPFHTTAYAEAMRESGAESWLLVLRDEAAVRAGCVGLLTRGRLSAELQIVSLPDLPEPDPFWEGVTTFCRRRGVSFLSVNTFASSSSDIPKLGIEQDRIDRYEFIVSLTEDRKLSANHRRNIKRANNAGVEIVRVDEPDAAVIHAQLIGSSMRRRQQRGEDVSLETSEASARKFLASGSGCLFQARLAGDSVSSILILVAATGGYYHSAGSSAEGMNSGASSLLISEVAERLAGEGKKVLNLGGAVPSQSGLIRFKSGFGSRRVSLEAANFFVGSGARRHLLNAVRSARAPWNRLVTMFRSASGEDTAKDAVPGSQD